MQFIITEKPSECEIVRDDVVVGTVKFNAYDVEKRAKFFEAFAKLSTFPAEISAGNHLQAFEKANKRAIELFNGLSADIDDIFGDGTTQLLTDGNKDPAVLMEFLAFAASEFRTASGLKIAKYVGDENSGVMPE